MVVVVAVVSALLSCTADKETPASSSPTIEARSTRVPCTSTAPSSSQTPERAARDLLTALSSSAGRPCDAVAEGWTLTTGVARRVLAPVRGRRMDDLTFTSERDFADAARVVVRDEDLHRLLTVNMTQTSEGWSAVLGAPPEEVPTRTTLGDP
jgi:hypothetical protein